MSSYLVKGARIVGAESTDLLIRDGVVAETGRGLDDLDLPRDGVR